MKVTWKRRLKRLVTLVACLAVAAALLLVFLAVTGLDERWARGIIVGQIEKMTGARVELGGFHFQWFGLRAELDDLTLHGRETEGMPPFVHVDQIRVDVRIVSFWSRQIALGELSIERPAVAVRIGEDGTSNVPAPKTQGTSRPLRERLFELVIQKLRVDDGYILFNQAREPLAAEGQNFRFALDFDAPAPGRETYVGTLAWKQMAFAARRYLPFRSDLSAKFTLMHDAFSLDDLRWTLPHSEFQIRAELPSFRQPAWNFHYRGRVNLGDVRAILRKPHSPLGIVEFSGAGGLANGAWTASGHWAAHDFAMLYEWFHTKGIESSGRFEVARGRLDVPAFEARVLGGKVDGRMEMQFHGLAFRVVSRARGMNLSAVLGAVDNRRFPMHTFHWGGSMDVDAVTTWTADFKHIRSKGESRWTPLAADTAASLREIPAGARLDYDYSMDQRTVAVNHSEITTPKMRLNMDGTLGADDSAVEVQLDAENLLDWDEFIKYVRGVDAEPQRTVGRATWRGRVLGPLADPTFAGHVHAFDARYGLLSWDEIEGDMTYSPDEFRLANTRVRRGKSTAALDLQLQFDGDWSFLPENRWNLEAKFNRGSTDDLQGLFETSYPAHALLTGEFRGDNTRADPRIDGDFHLEEADVWGVALDSARGQLHLRHGEVSLQDAELRKNGAIVKGDFALNTKTREVEFALRGSGIQLEKINQLQSASLPVEGLFEFDLRGKGPLLAPVAQGNVRLTKFRAGSDTVGTLEGRLDSDGRRLRVTMNSAMTAGTLRGQLDLGLSGDYPLTGEMMLDHIDLDPFIKAGLHLQALTGHSSVDGHFALSGALLRPGSMVIQADISRIALNYANVQLENDGPLRLVYRRDEVRVEQAHLRGPDTDFHFAGSAQFTGNRSLKFDLSGQVNLRLVGGFVPRLEARGAAHVDAALEGTLSNPRLTGKVQVTDAAANYGDFPAGLSHMTGEFVFDRSRLVFDHVTAEAGGGTLALAGSVSYAESPARYEITVAAKSVRIRYPEGLSWLAGGTLRLTGTTLAGTLSGRIVVGRLLLGPNADLATLILASQEAPRGPATSSAFLRNLQFDIQADSSPDARLEWTGARVQIEGSLRVRGTWEHPILLGHLHLLGGEMDFRGNRYTLSRGDINFANPFRMDPVLNVEATTTINQYEITLDFTGPASHLSLAYRSDPPLPSSDVVALLALGTTGEESALRSSTASAQNYGATALLSEAISSQLGGRIERLFGISRFRVDPFLAGTATEQNPAARITIEQRVTHDLTITYSTNATSNQQQVIQVEYAVRRDVSIIFLRDINGTFGLDVKFKKRFK